MVLISSEQGESMRVMPSRYSGVQAAVGADLFKHVSGSRVLMVGAGGIGCELLKNLVMSGFGEIEVVDLDTIDLSNLNRQFLFQHRHIGKAKAHVAKESALGFNPDAKIKSHHASIYEAQFDQAWFKSFDLVLNALDNLAARRHVNAMCLAANVPLIESEIDTVLRLRWQTQSKDISRLYNSKHPKRPDTLHRVGQKLFVQLFGKPEDEEETINEEQTSDNAKEMAHLLHEKEALKRLREAAGTPEYGKLVFEKVFTDDVKGLLVMEDLWKNRRPPTPLNFAEATSDPSVTSTPADELAWDRKVWSIEENTRVFLDSLHELAVDFIEQQKRDPEFSMSFDKDDLAALNFVTATANLRAEVYGLEKKSRFAVKEMAGNIIPAVATTNAIIAGLIVMTAIKVLAGEWSSCKNTWVARNINPERLDKPNPSCAVCTINSYTLAINTESASLGDLLEMVVKGSPGESPTSGLGIQGEIAIQEGERLLYDVEFDDNLDMSLSELGIRHATRVMITNENDDDETGNSNVSVILYIEHRDEFGMPAKPFFTLDGDRTLVPRPRAPSAAPDPPKATSTATNNKRPAVLIDSDLGGNKRQKQENGNGDGVMHILDEDDTVLLIE
ncbi:hypothetical protein PhCBS80983_g00432 [Powellomyces hirtus]|uniref:Ubiquitin-activating enzyme E1-like n=1 Tax=Powellomyces hirtus TaxID=109895 RepID=A0A507EE36_9FUNG|nr:hypothetical protein PhCBS80983_g00432 [Powellomyces hirtus]